MADRPTAPDAAPPDPSWRTFRVTVAALGAVPLASGLAGVLLGTGGVPGGPGGDVSPSLESEYRFANAFWLAVAPVVWWSVAAPRERGPVLRAVLATVGASGLARLLAWRTAGRPHPAFVASTALELVGMPAVLAWHARLAADPATSAAGGAALRAVNSPLINQTRTPGVS